MTRRWPGGVHVPSDARAAAAVGVQAEAAARGGGAARARAAGVLRAGAVHGQDRGGAEVGGVEGAAEDHLARNG
jgi:hypothetical protein